MLRIIRPAMRDGLRHAIDRWLQIQLAGPSIKEKSGYAAHIDTFIQQRPLLCQRRTSTVHVR
ncbi:hypothetical protein [Hankyongella ginsenosidimutans]|uniref:hypothetical protein n=1 Tax=Hankyongella ginsenosidimutans TaxID=1763828 RepID=UPI001CA341A1|nr:hypothetical protein [Hankyongella ginsenosidimutans]